MTEQEQKRACGLLDTQYGYILEKYPGDLQQQLTYYTGMKVMIEDLLLGTDLCLIRDKAGRHSIKPIDLPY